MSADVFPAPPTVNAPTNVQTAPWPLNPGLPPAASPLAAKSPPADLGAFASGAWPVVPPAAAPPSHISAPSVGSWPLSARCSLHCQWLDIRSSVFGIVV